MNVYAWVYPSVYIHLYRLAADTAKGLELLLALTDAVQAPT